MTGADVGVAVVGAGVAGLTAARELRRRGVDVVVLEARARRGGRVHTVRVDDLETVELGAQVLHGADHPLAPEPLGTDAPSVVGRSEGQRTLFVMPDGERRALTSDQFAAGRPVPPLAAAALRRFGARLVPSVRRAVPVSDALRRAGLDAVAAEAFLRWSEERVGEDISPVSLADWESTPVYTAESEVQHRPADGLASLVDGLAAGLDIRLRHRVTDVDATGEGVSLTAVGPHGESVTLRAEAALVTVPPAVVGSGRLRVQGMSEDAVAAAQSVRMAPGTVRVVRLDRPAPSDAFAADLHDGTGLGLVTWTQGSAAAVIVSKGSSAVRAGRSLSDPATDDEVCGRVAALASALGGGLPSPTGLAAWHDWTSDPASLGAFALPSSSMPSRWAEPVRGVVHWAGEAVPGGGRRPYLDTAYASALAAVPPLIDALLKEPS